MTNEEIVDQSLGISQPNGVYWHIVLHGKTLASFRAKSGAKHALRGIKEALLRLLREAREAGCQDALAMSLPGQPMSDEEVLKANDRIRQDLEVAAMMRRSDHTIAASEFLAGTAADLLSPMMEQILFLTVVLRDASLSGELDRWKAGYKMGRREATRIMSGENSGEKARLLNQHISDLADEIAVMEMEEPPQGD